MITNVDFQYVHKHNQNIVNRTQAINTTALPVIRYIRMYNKKFNELDRETRQLFTVNNVTHSAVHLGQYHCA